MSALLCPETLSPRREARAPAAPGGIYRCLPGDCAGLLACGSISAALEATEANTAAALRSALTSPWWAGSGLTPEQHDLACTEKGVGLCVLLGAREGRPGVYSLACVTRHALGPLPRVLELATAQDRYRALQIRRQHHALWAT